MDLLITVTDISISLPGGGYQTTTGTFDADIIALDSGSNATDAVSAGALAINVSDTASPLDTRETILKQIVDVCEAQLIGNSITVTPGKRIIFGLTVSDFYTYERELVVA